MKSIWKLCRLIILMMVTLLPLIVQAQKVLLDEPVRAGELTLFPSVDNPNEFYYLLDKVKLSSHPDGKPQFSLLRYVQNENASTKTAGTTEEQGGGILHALIELYIPPEDIKEADRELKRINPNWAVKKQILYENGTVSLVSSFKADNGEWVKRVLGIGKAAIMANHKMAISIQLTNVGSRILWESFKTATSDMSISLEMEISGYRSPAQVIIEANFDRIYEHRTFEAAVVTPVFAAEIKTAFDELVNNGGIKVIQIKEDENMDKARETAYNMLIKMMFDPLGGMGTPSFQQSNQQQEGKSMLDRATEMLNTARKEVKEENEQIEFENKEDEKRYKQLVSEIEETVKKLNKEFGHEGDLPEKPEAEKKQELPTFAAAVSYQMKTIRNQGVLNINLNKYTTDNLSFRFDHNVTVNPKEHPYCFTEVFIDQDHLRERVINVHIDGCNAQDFGKFINYIDILLRKKHEDGFITDREIMINSAQFNLQGNQFKLQYGWHNDKDRSKWYEYEYKILCNYLGGLVVETDWMKSVSGTIPIVPEFNKKVIDFEVNPEIMSARQALSVEIRVFYKLNDREFTQEVMMNFNKKEFSQQIELILPRNNPQFDYLVTWHIKGKDPVASERKTSSNLILYLDEIQ